MNIHNRSRYLLAFVGLVLYLVLGLTVTQGAVLCIESDGQVSVEAGIEGVCSDEWENVSVQAAANHESILQASHCKHCVDVPLTFISSKGQCWALSESHHSINQPIIALQPSNTWMEHLEQATTSLLPHPPPPAKPQIHTYLSTVILLN